MSADDVRIATDLMCLGYRREIVIRWLQGRRGSLMGVRTSLVDRAVRSPSRTRR